MAIQVHKSDSFKDIKAAIIELQRRIQRLEDNNLSNSNGWAGQQSNVTIDRAFNANSTTTDEIADVLGTLISDLLKQRILK